MKREISWILAKKKKKKKFNSQEDLMRETNWLCIMYVLALLIGLVEGI